ncbi:MAG TPA: HAD family phosphatase [Gemmataceae bacterium]|nr:HAD family phosphatase [Gemmataceae bacterium]
METPIWRAPRRTGALIFDCDGTLADTMPAHYLAWTTMLGKYGIPFSQKRFYELGGVPTAQIIHILSRESGVPVNDVDEMVHEKESAFLANLHAVRPVARVYDIGRDYRHVLPMAVASGGYRDVVHRTLAVIGVAEWFDVVVTAEDTTRHKPEPDVFLEAARRLRVPPAMCLVFEDTDIGLEAARRAGMASVDVREWVKKQG